MERVSLLTLLLVLIVIGGISGIDGTGGTGMAAAQDESRFSLPVLRDWRSEQIPLPPPFAKKMALRGLEDIRFAPGMFNEKAEDFFSYYFIFDVEANPKLTADVLRRELLVYYRGLSEAVHEGAGLEVDSSAFSLTLKPAKTVVRDGARQPPRYVGDLKWVEPFQTRKKQTLHMEVDAWSVSKSKRNVVFVCVSPQKTSAAVWKTMRQQRARFLRSYFK